MEIFELCWIMVISLSILNKPKICIGDVEVSIKHLTRGKRLTSGIFKTFEKMLFASCLKQCALRKRCVAFTFNLKDISCELGSSTSFVEDSNDPRYITSEPGNWSNEIKDFIGACANHSCPIGTTCTVLKSSSICCIRTECEEPEHIYFATEQPKDWSVGKTFTYTCQPNYVMNGGPPKRTCQQNGKWTRRNFYCTLPTCDVANGYTAGKICYKMYKQLSSHYDARRICESTGGQLAKMRSATQRNFLRDKTNVKQVWIDGTDDLEEGTWRYFDGKLVTYSPWYSGNGNKGPDYNCRLFANSLVTLPKCSSKEKFLCEIP